MAIQIDEAPLSLVKFDKPLGDEERKSRTNEKCPQAE